MRLSAFLTALLTFSSSFAYQGTIAYEQSRIAIQDVQLIDGTGGPVQKGMTVIFEKGRIIAVGVASQTAIPAETQVISGKGKTLLPGFVMVHEHMFYPTGKRNYTEMLHSFPSLYLAGGTTTIRTAGTMNPYGDLNLKKAIDAGQVHGPDIHVTAPYMEGPGLPIYKVKALRGVTDAERSTEFWSAEGATSFKAYMHIKEAELAAVIDQAHYRHHHVTAHLCSVTYRRAAELGIDNLEHGFFVATDFVKDKQRDVCPNQGDIVKSFRELDLDDPRVDDLIQFLIEKKVSITSTPTVFETFVSGRPKAYPEALAVLMPEIRKQYEATWERVAKGTNDSQKILYEKAMALEMKFVEAGGTLLLGTDPTGYGGVVPGFASKRIIELMLEQGYGLEQVIRFATLNGATFMKIQADVGSVAVGKRADLILLDGDLVSDSSAIRRMPLVFKKGVGYDSAAIFKSMENTVGLH